VGPKMTTLCQDALGEYIKRIEDATRAIPKGVDANLCAELDELVNKFATLSQDEFLQKICAFRMQPRRRPDLVTSFLSHDPFGKVKASILKSQRTGAPHVPSGSTAVVIDSLAASTAAKMIERQKQQRTQEQWCMKMPPPAGPPTKSSAPAEHAESPESKLARTADVHGITAARSPRSPLVSAKEEATTSTAAAAAAVAAATAAIAAAACAPVNVPGEKVKEGKLSGGSAAGSGVSTNNRHVASPCRNIFKTPVADSVPAAPLGPPPKGLPQPQVPGLPQPQQPSSQAPPQVQPAASQPPAQPQAPQAEVPQPVMIPHSQPPVPAASRVSGEAVGSTVSVSSGVSHVSAAALASVPAAFAANSNMDHSEEIESPQAARAHRGSALFAAASTAPALASLESRSSQVGMASAATVVPAAWNSALRASSQSQTAPSKREPPRTPSGDKDPAVEEVMRRIETDNKNTPSIAERRKLFEMNQAGGGTPNSRTATAAPGSAGSLLMTGRGQPVASVQTAPLAQTAPLQPKELFSKPLGTDPAPSTSSAPTSARDNKVKSQGAPAATMQQSNSASALSGGLTGSKSTERLGQVTRAAGARDDVPRVKALEAANKLKAEEERRQKLKQEREQERKAAAAGEKGASASAPPGPAAQDPPAAKAKKKAHRRSAVMEVQYDANAAAQQAPMESGKWETILRERTEARCKAVADQMTNEELAETVELLLEPMRSPRRTKPPVPVFEEPEPSWARLRHVQAPLARPEDEYEISEPEDEDAEDYREKDRSSKHVPKWCENYHMELQAKADIDPDSVFGMVPHCNLEEIFTDSCYQQVKVKRPQRKRGSSGDWRKDNLEFLEIKDYKSRMGHMKTWEAGLSQQTAVA